MQIRSLLVWATQELKSISLSPHLDAELLLGEVLQLTRAQLITQSQTVLSPELMEKFKTVIARRKTGEPVAYLLGYREFWSLNLEVTPATLIPRPETELLVEIALKKFSPAEAIQVADLGTGSGAIALALAYERSHWSVTATDKSVAALAVAQRNAQCLNINNVSFREGSWCDVFSTKEMFHMIVSNPPYIANDDLHIQESVLAFEPREALVANENGFFELHLIVAQARYHLRKGGWLILEHGFEQKKILNDLLCKYGYVEIENHQDFSGKMRISVARMVM